MTLPTNWTIAQLADVASWGSGGTPARGNPNFYGGSIPWIKTGELGQKYLTQTEECLTEEGIKNSSAKIFRKGSVALAMYGATIGKTSILGIDSSCNQACAIGTPFNEVVIAPYLYYFFRGEQKNFIAAGQGGAQPNISQALIKAWDIALPPLNEQRRIVAKLDALYEKNHSVREKLNRLPRLLANLQKSILNSAFRGELTKEWRADNPNVEPASELLKRIRAERRAKWEADLIAKGKDPKKAKYIDPDPINTEGLPRLPDGWCWTSLDQLATHYSGVAFASSDFTDAGIQVVKLGNLYRGSLDLSRSPAFLPLDHPEIHSAIVIPGDILVSQTGTRHKRDYGYFCAVENLSAPGLVINQRVLGIRPFLPELTRLIELASRLEVYQEHFFSHETGGVNQGNVGIAGVMRGPIPIPPLEEVKVIVKLLGQAQKNLQQLQSIKGSLLNRLSDAETGFLSQAFRGELVSQDPNDEPAAVLLERIRAQTQAAGTKRDRARHAAA